MKAVIDVENENNGRLVDMKYAKKGAHPFCRCKMFFCHMNRISTEASISKWRLLLLCPNYSKIIYLIQMLSVQMTKQILQILLHKVVKFHSLSPSSHLQVWHLINIL